MILASRFGRITFLQLDPKNRQLIQKHFKSQMADQICYAILCVFSYVAAGQNKAYLPDPIPTTSAIATTAATTTTADSSPAVATSSITSTAAVDTPANGPQQVAEVGSRAREDSV